MRAWVTHPDAGRLWSSRVEIREASVAARQRAFGGAHPDTLSARVELALGYRERERDQDAVDTLQDVVAICDGVLGPEPAPARTRPRLDNYAGQPALISAYQA